jgi:hypothetical protein
MAQLPSYSTVTLRVRHLAPGRAELLELLADGPLDDALAARAAALREPVIKTDAVLGRLTLDRRVDTWGGTSIWCGKEVRVALDAGDDVEFAAALKVAHTLWKDQELWTERVNQCALLKLLPLKNESWLDDDEEPVSPVQFLERMTLEEISVSPEEDITFWHNDGDLFWGHAIQVMGNLADGLTDADIPG